MTEIQNAPMQATEEASVTWTSFVNGTPSQGYNATDNTYTTIVMTPNAGSSNPEWCIQFVFNVTLSGDKLNLDSIKSATVYGYGVGPSQPIVVRLNAKGPAINYPYIVPGTAVGDWWKADLPSFA